MFRFLPLLTVVSVTLLVAVTSPACGDTDIVVDDFESYANAAALQAAWVSTGSAGDPSSSTLLTAAEDAVYSNYDGQAAIFNGANGIGGNSVNRWQATALSVAPTPTQHVELTVDLGHDFLTSNKRLSLGLRGAAGIIELGFYNQLPQGPNGEFLQMAYGNFQFASGGTNSWRAYSLDQALDQLFEIGAAAFHRFQAVITENDVTFSLDLYADGLDNVASRGADYDRDGDVDGNDFLVAQRDSRDLLLFAAQFGAAPTPVLGVDATDRIPAIVNAGGFDDLRFGIPSAFGSSADPVLAVDNVSLRLVDIVEVQSPVGAIPEPSGIVLACFAMVQAGWVARLGRQAGSPDWVARLGRQIGPLQQIGSR